MAWTNPKTWVVDELVTAEEMNTEIRDNLNVLKLPPSEQSIIDEGSNYSTTSTSFVDVDATNLSLTITTTGGDVLITFPCSVSNNANSGQVFLELALDTDGGGDNNIAGDDGMIVSTDTVLAQIVPITLIWIAKGLAAGVHTFKVRWKVVSGTATMFAGAGTGGADVHPQFSLREI